MLNRLPRWLLFTLLGLLLVIIVTGLVVMIHSGGVLWYIGWGISALLVIVLIVLISVSAPQLIKLYKFQKYFKAHEEQLKTLPSLLQTGRTQEAMMRFEGMMKHAPDNAYLYYMQAFMLKAGGKLNEALVATDKALALASNDPYLKTMLQQAGGQMGQPTTVDEFKQSLTELRRTLEPRVNSMRERHEKAVAKRKKKSR
jgi:tetratricopeptide (TPR) repeat protein